MTWLSRSDDGLDRRRALRLADLNGDAILDVAFATDPVTVHLGSPTATTQLKGPAGEFSTKVANPDGSFTQTLKNATRIEFDTAGLQTAMVDANGNATTFDYDGQDQLTTITDPVGLVTTLVYPDRSAADKRPGARHDPLAAPPSPDRRRSAPGRRRPASQIRSADRAIGCPGCRRSTRREWTS